MVGETIATNQAYLSSTSSVGSSECVSLCPSRLFQYVSISKQLELKDMLIISFKQGFRVEYSINITTAVNHPLGCLCRFSVMQIIVF